MAETLKAGHIIGKEICEKLGIDPQWVQKLVLTIEVDSVPKLEIIKIATAEECHQLFDKLSENPYQPSVELVEPKVVSVTDEVTIVEDGVKEGYQCYRAK